MSPGSTQTQLRLGPFQIHEELGRGAMAQVRRAVHSSTRTPVALKLISRDDSARGAARARALHNEVRALSVLDHPNIVVVYDYGEVDPSAAEASDGLLIAGTPWLAMEFVGGGTLAALPRLASFEQLRELLLQILEALGHAHGRGVIHRDLKPSNVLMRETQDGRLAPCLADFGIASAIRSAIATSTSPLPAGTPRYMAPEQVLGRAREEGPSTDLYALGCVAWELVSGRAPFVGRAEDVCRAHAREPLPPLTARFAVPQSFGVWLEGCLAKRARGRFPNAATAHMALQSIDPHSVALGIASVPPLALQRDDLATSVAKFHAATTLTEGAVHRPRSGAGRPSIPSPSTWPRPGLPDAWPRPPRRSRRLREVGLGLYGLRPVPLAGRVQERDVLWRALLDVEASARPRVVCLRGPTGVGKTRLAEWLLALVAELGVAVPVRAFHGEVVGPSEGLNAMIERALECRGLEGAELEARVVAWSREVAPASEMRQREVDDILAVLTCRVLRFPSPSDRYAAIRRCLARIARVRPAVLLLDDALMSADSIRFALSLRDHPDPRLPVLVLVTMTDEHVKKRPALAPLLEELMRAPFGSTLHVPPLDPDSHRELVEDLLGLSGELAHEVEERTMGNPLFAIQLVGDWVGRGVLAPSETGFRLADEAEALIPDDVHQVCAARVQDALAYLGPARHEARIALELGAALGHSVHLGEWREACSLAHVAPSSGLLDRLAAAGLIRVGVTSWSFTHGMLRECVERGAAEGRRLTLHHALIHSLLSCSETAPERIAHHALGALDHRSALIPLERAAQEHLVRGVPGRALALLDQHAEALAYVLEEDPTRRARGALLRAEAHAVAGRPDQAAEVIESLDIQQWDAALQAAHAWLTGLVHQKRGEATGARAAYTDALTRYEALGDRIGQGRCHFGLAETVKLLGELDAARGFYERAQAMFEVTGRDAEAVRALTGLADVETRAGRLDIAAVHLELGMAALEELGHRGAHAIAQNGLGDLERRRGDLDAASRAYEAASATLEETGSQDVWFVRTNIALVHLARGQYAEAESILERAEAQFVRQQRERYAQLTRALRLPCSAARGDWAQWDALMLTIDEGLLVDPDVAFALELAARLAVKAAEFDRASVARRLAISQRRVLGAHDLADALEQEGDPRNG